MKTAVSISIGSSKRNKKYPLHILGQDVSIERVGTDGDMGKAAQLFHEMDGKVDAFGVGGADLGFLIGEKFYRMHSVTKLTRGVKTTPVVDGNGLKATLEYKVRPLLEKELAERITGKRVLLTAGIDRWGLSRAFLDLGYECVFGDLMFGLGLPIPLRTEKSLRGLVHILLPVVSHFPFSWLYPIGSEQEKHTPKWSDYFDWASVIAGDCHYITRYMPPRLDGKVVITNTTTPEDVALFKSAGVRTLVTTTPVLDGRSFGTNMMEAAILAATGRKEPVDYSHASDYIAHLAKLVDQIPLNPQIQELNS
ncbi:MAG: quinate 5-dehydrogenase [Anaerolineaceae bacterium]|nr:quinate 5-dehydrogenase [Anaerolineaceae bacterium]